MSFVRTLATLAVGFAAARGYDRYKKIGGMDGVKDTLKKAGEPGGAVDQWGEQVEKLGLPGGAKMVRQMYEQFGGASEAAEAGIGNLIGSMTSAATAGGKAMGDMMDAMTSASPASAIAEENARLMIRSMIQAAKADGEIDAEERARILDQLGDASDDELAFVEAELDRPLDPMALAEAAGATMREQVYSSALMAIRLDTPAEQGFLDQLATALGLDVETRARLDQAMRRGASA